MSYYKLLGLTKEPFSNSPDPDFFYESKGHHAVLTSLMIEIRLRRGMSLVLGDVGAGKTTLSRKLFQMLKTRPDILLHMILDPGEESEQAFLNSLLRAFNLPLVAGPFAELQGREAIKRYLFKKGVEEGITVVLLVDEAQKLNPMSLEILRTLLNYETNEYKLLQLVLLAQMELLPAIRAIRNLWDRISYKHILPPLDVEAVREMIAFRLRQAGYAYPQPLFSEEAVAEVCRHTQGYPRRIGMLCHNILKALVMEGGMVVSEDLVRGVISEQELVSV